MRGQCVVVVPDAEGAARFVCVSRSVRCVRSMRVVNAEVCPVANAKSSPMREMRVRGQEGQGQRACEQGDGRTLRRCARDE